MLQQKADNGAAVTAAEPSGADGEKPKRLIKANGDTQMFDDECRNGNVSVLSVMACGLVDFLVEV